MTDEQYRIEKIKDYRRDILRLHPVRELRERFARRDFDETFAAMGKLIDPECETPVWTGFEYVCAVHEDYISPEHQLIFDKIY